MPQDEVIEVVWACLCTMGEDGEPNLPGEAIEIEPDAKRVVAKVGPLPHRLMVFVRQYLYEGTHAAGNVFIHRPYPNLMDDRAIARYIEVNHQPYQEHLKARFGVDAGKVFEAAFTDEPSLMSAFVAGGDQPAPVVPWCYDLPQQFAARHEWDVRPLLPYLFEGQGGEQAQTRFMFWDLVADLVATRFFGQLQAWCAKYGLASSGHLLGEETLTQHVYFYGDALRSARRFDWPGIDQLASRLGPMDAVLPAKLLGSAAELTGAPRVMTEVSDYSERHGSPDKPITDDEILGCIGWQYVLGVNTATSYYDLNDEAFNPKNVAARGLTLEHLKTWTLRPRYLEDKRGLNDWAHINDYVARMGEVLVGSRWAGQIGVVYPIEAEWAYSIPQRSTVYERKEPAEAIEVDEAWVKIGTQMILERLDFIYVDRQAMAEARVTPGWMGVAEARLRCIVLPPMRYISRETMGRLHEFWNEGGRVATVGHAPEFEAETGRPGQVGKWAEEMFGRIDEVRLSGANGRAVVVDSAAELGKLLRYEWRMGDVEVGPPEAPVAVTLRRQGEQRFVMVLNTSMAARTVGVVAPFGTAQVWDPETGAIKAAREGRQGIEVALGPGRAVFLIESKD